MHKLGLQEVEKLVCQGAEQVSRVVLCPSSLCPAFRNSKARNSHDEALGQQDIRTKNVAVTILEGRYCVQS